MLDALPIALGGPFWVRASARPSTVIWLTWSVSSLPPWIPPVVDAIGAPTWTDVLGAVAGAVSAGAVVVAALFAYRAWREQKSGLRDENVRESVRRVGAAIVELTTGEISDAREDVTSWVAHQAAPSPAGHAAIRAGRLDGGNADEQQVRQHAFLLMWALHRLAALWADVDRVSSEQKSVLRFHVGQILATLQGLDHLLKHTERNMFSDSAAVAQQAVTLLGERLDGVELGLDWSVSLAGFLRER